ncbi:DUF3592 domain-containing protein [Hymenobacter sp. B81]|uniref:DUF3592 domain-containing protein n=1 Tax=Hymenobacter sp. B81 TaxID=3344878 RepID=UPI0037DDE0DC
MPTLDAADERLIQLVVFGGFFLIGAILMLRKAAHIRRHGTETTGTVIRLEEQTSRRSTVYVPVVRFLTTQQEWITARYHQGTNPASHHEGETVRLRYLPADPTTFTIMAPGSDFMLYLFLLLGAGIIVYALIEYVGFW